jgi:hypothetical protein
MPRIIYWDCEVSNLVVAARKGWDYGKPYGMGHDEAEAQKRLLAQEQAYYDE